MKLLLTRRFKHTREHTCNQWRLVVLSIALVTGCLYAQAQTPASTVPLALPTTLPVQAASTAPPPVLGTLILSPLERRQLDAASQLATKGQGSFLVPGGQGRTAAPMEAPMFWINRRPPDDASAGRALGVLSGNFGSANADTKNAVSGIRPVQTTQTPGADLPPGAITINRATPRAGDSNPGRMPVN